MIAQILVLRRRFEPIQLFQLLIGFLFGCLLDVNIWLTDFFSTYESLLSQIVAQSLGATILGCAVALEIRCGSVTMPGEGIQVAIARVWGKSFPTVKILVDTILVLLAALSGLCFFGSWPWTVVGPGTLFAMFYVGYVVKLVNPHLLWFDRLMDFKPGLKRYIYGLARFIYPKREW